MHIPGLARYDGPYCLPQPNFSAPFLNEFRTAMTNRLDTHLPAAGAFALVGLLLAVVRATVVLVVGVVTPPAQV